MEAKTDTVRVHVNIDIPVDALQAIVAAAKRRAGRNEKGYYQVDTADAVGRSVSRFLLEKDFSSYAARALQDG